LLFEQAFSSSLWFLSIFDILVQFSNKPGWQKENEVLDIIYEAELKYDIIIDAKVYHDEEIKKQNNPFRVNVMSEGTFYEVSGKGQKVCRKN